MKKPINYNFKVSVLEKDARGFSLRMVTDSWDTYHLQAKPTPVICLLDLANSSYYRKILIEAIEGKYGWLKR